MRRILGKLLRFFLFVFLIILVSLGLLFLAVTSPPRKEANDAAVINDVTEMNPIRVNGTLRLTTIDEIVSLVSSHDAPISIGGARHSMGGQIGTDGSLHLDMRELDEVVSFSPERKEITVQSGITWRKIQEHIDPFDLSVRIMQTYANFTVGGSLSVNVHGRYVGQGPIIYSVKSIKVVLPNGELVDASRNTNSEIFYGCIGGYGGLGVIVEATLSLTNNCKVVRKTQVMPAREYYNYFLHHVQNDSSIIFHNADIYPNEYKEIRAVSYTKTEQPVTIEERLKPNDQNYRLERFAMWIVSEMPYGKWVRQNLGDPLAYKSDQVKWRNYEASFDVMELEPTSRKNSTYVLQEYFVPVDQFDTFLAQMKDVFRRHNANVINISIRHAKKDSESMLAWAQTEVFCFVIYYKQGTGEQEISEVGLWTRELIDAAVSHGGSFYLPYQLHATKEQFYKAYPNAVRFFNLKRKLDPINKFRNKLWNEYYIP